MDGNRASVLVFSADENKIVYSEGEQDRHIVGGLGFPLLIYYIINLVNKETLKFTDLVTVDRFAEDESKHDNSLGLSSGERINLFNLFSASLGINSPDAIIAMGRYARSITNVSTVKNLQKLAKQFGASEDAVKNLTGRSYDENSQSFNIKDLLAIAKNLLSFDVLNFINNNTCVYKDKFIKPNTILFQNKDILRCLVFGEDNNYHAIALSELENETLYIAVCGAKDSLERDTALIKAIHESKTRGAVKKKVEPTKVDKDILTLTGDTYCGERYTQWRIKRSIEDPIQLYGDEGYAFSFKDVSKFLNEDSFNIVNSECVLSPVYDKTQQTGKYLDFILGGNPEKTIKCYKDVNIDAVLTANNHSMDFGAAGIRQTNKYFSDAKFLKSGSGENIDKAHEPIFIDLNGNKVMIFGAYGFLAKKRHELFNHYSLGNNTGTAFLTDKLDSPPFLDTVKEYRKLHPDAYIILSPHWSTDFNEKHKHLRPIARKAFEAGVDLIIGHGPHIPVGAEHLDSKLVVYSLGNFVFNTTGIDLDASGKSPYGLVSRLNFKDGNLILKLYPIYVHNINTFFQPRPTTKEQFEEFISTFIGLKKFTKEQDELGYNLTRVITLKESA